jgi:hypothetical protein
MSSYICIQVFILIIIVSIIVATPVGLEDILPVFPPELPHPGVLAM